MDNCDIFLKNILSNRAADLLVPESSSRRTARTGTIRIESADVVKGLREFGCRVTVCDPHAAPEKVQKEYGFSSEPFPPREALDSYSVVVLTMAHREFTAFDLTGFSGAIYETVKAFYRRT